LDGDNCKFLSAEVGQEPRRNFTKPLFKPKSPLAFIPLISTGLICIYFSSQFFPFYSSLHTSENLCIVEVSLNMGSVEWFTGIGLAAKYTQSLIHRCAIRNVDVETVQIAQALGSLFRQSKPGMDNFQKALDSAKREKGYRGMLLFGIDVEELSAELNKSSEGWCWIALASALSSIFHIDHASAVMHELVYMQNLPRQYHPSPDQWHNLISSCSGFLEKTDFPDIAEFYIGLAQQQQEPVQLKSSRVKLSTDARGCPTATAMAEALCGMAKVSRGEVAKIELSGCFAIGWFAALAQWVFGLTVAIYRSDHPEDPIACNSTSPGMAQVVICFEIEGIQTKISNELIVSANTYRLEDASALIDNDVFESTIHFVSGRVPWDRCLAHAFGLTFRKLIDRSATVGKGIASAAKLFESLSRAGEEWSQKDTYYCRSYFSSSSGHGFILNTVESFPELVAVRPHADREYAEMKTFSDARTKYEQVICALRDDCCCVVCCAMETDDEHAGFCFVVLFETMIWMSQVLSGINTENDINPRAMGLHSCYYRQLETRKEEEILKRANGELGHIAHVLEFNKQPIERMDYWMPEEVYERRLVDALRIFSGRPCNTAVNQQQVTAISSDGICAYLEILQDLSIDPERVGRVRIVPGRIYHNGRTYEAVYDCRDYIMDKRYNKDAIWSWEDAMKGEHEVIEHNMFLKQTKGRSISIVYELHFQNGKYLHLEPAEFLYKVSRARGRIRCHRRSPKGCHPLNKLPDQEKTVQTYCHDGYGRSVEILMSHDPISRCALAWMTEVHEEDHATTCIVEGPECISCSIRASFAMEKDVPAILRV
jgi:hypothetical protein